MQLTMRDMIDMFKVSEATVTRWVKQQGLQAQRIAGQFRFNRVEVLDWAIAHQLILDSKSVDHGFGGQPQVSLGDALEAGGIHYQVPGENQEGALREVVSRLSLPDGFDRGLLLQLFLAREAVGSTAVGDGIAIPHVRRPIILHVARSLVTLCFLKRPVVYQAPDGKPVRILFSVISPTVSAHMQLLARLSRALHDPGFRRSVVEAKPSEIILREARRVEQGEQPAETIKPRAA